MDNFIKLLPFIIGVALGVVAVSVVLDYTENFTGISFKDIFLVVPAIMVLLTGIYIIYRSIKDLGLKEE